ncbi:MAG TPA: hypothetical protein VF556_12725 [Pyrinomonadaceae bacterium]|jgi:uncharacterized damage-inducible protein DinB
MKNNENIYAVSADLTVESLAAELFRGAKLIGKIEDKFYRQKANGTGSIGGHFRHNLDFINAFLNGIQKGKIDYHQRERNLRIEENRLYAIKRIAFTVCKLRSLSAESLRQKISIRSEIDESLWLKSSAMRELEFLHSHTVHHYALVAEKLAFFGVKVSNNFGVAPSTLKFWAKQAA